MRIVTLFVASAMSLATATPAIAQDATLKDGMHAGAMAHMSATDMRRMNNCKAMSHERMMRNASCRRVKEMHSHAMHPDAMQPESAMGHEAMKPGQ